MIFTVAGKELKALFVSPLAWVVLACAQILLGYSFLRRLDDFLQLQPQLLRMASPPGVTELVVAPTFATAAAILLFAAPLLGMRLIAEERRNRTMVFLLSAPLSLTSIVLGKFTGLLAFVTLIAVLVAGMPLALVESVSLDYGLLASMTLGLVLLAGAFTAISLYVSSLTAHPLVAAIGAFGALLAMLFMGETAIDGLRTRNWPLAAALVQVLAPLRNFEPLAKGIIDSYAIVCLLLLIAATLALTIRQLDARRLRG
jgi:ABC-2 type transport system permease protein